MSSKSWSRLEEATPKAVRDVDGSKGAEAARPESRGRRALWAVLGRAAGICAVPDGEGHQIPCTPRLSAVGGRNRAPKKGRPELDSYLLCDSMLWPEMWALPWRPCPGAVEWTPASSR